MKQSIQTPTLQAVLAAGNRRTSNRNANLTHTVEAAHTLAETTNLQNRPTPKP